MKTDENSEYSRRKYIGNLKSLKTDEYRKAYKFRLKTGEYRHVLVNGRIQIFFSEYGRSYSRFSQISYTFYLLLKTPVIFEKSTGEYMK